MNAPGLFGFRDALLAHGAAPEIPATDRIYDFLIGSWTMEVRDRLDDGTVRTAAGECHAAWVLEGRAVQDVWISPPASLRSATTPRPGNRYGTTLRVYDSRTRQWNVAWTNPVSGAENRLIGRSMDGEIVQEGQDPDGNPIRWCFRKITPTSLHWTGEISRDGGGTWELQTEFFMRRMAAPA